MLWRIDIGGHDVVVGAVEQNLAEELDGLPLGDVVLRREERVVARKELGIMGGEEGCYEVLVSC